MRVFLSYDRRDARRAEQIASALQEQGHQVWWDRQIKGGRRFGDEIEKALADADAVFVLWSKHAVTSDWVKDEAAAGRDSGRLVPTTLDGAQPPLGFRQYQTVDVSRLSGARLGNALDDAVRALVEPGSRATTSSTTSHLLTRRTALVGLGAAAIAGSAVVWWTLDHSQAAENPRVAALLDQAWAAWAQGTSEGNSQAIGLYRRATTEAPDHADSWGFLGCAYGDRGHNWVTGLERDNVWLRARECGRKALELDRVNAYGRAAVAYARPRRGNWALMEREFRRADREQPGKWLIGYSLALLMREVGRNSEAARLFGNLTQTAPTATQYLFHVQALWASGKLDQAERMLDEAAQIYGGSAAIWWQRFDMMLHGGRAAAASAFATDENARPANLAEADADQAAAIARAAASGRSSQDGKMLQELLSQARLRASQAARAMSYANILGSPDTAFQIADGLFFSRGFEVPDFAGAPGSAPQVTLDERRTRPLFLPANKSMWRDPRFPALLSELGLETYWRETKTLPDYRRA